MNRGIGLGTMPPDLTEVFNTRLGPEQERAYAEWLAALSRVKGHDAGRDLYDYDLRGAFASGVQADGRGHFTDEFKKPNHPTFSNESRYSSPRSPGGQWVETGDGRWGFNASPANLRFQTIDQLRDYFRRAEPDSPLWFPEETSPMGMRR